MRPVTVDSLRGKYGSVGPGDDKDGGELGQYALWKGEEKNAGCWNNYLDHLESIEAVGWFLIHDEQKLRSYTRADRFAVGLYKLMVNIAVGVCIRSLNTCEESTSSNSLAPSSGFLTSLAVAAVIAFIASLYELIFLVPLFRYVLSRDPREDGFFQRLGCSGSHLVPQRCETYV